MRLFNAGTTPVSINGWSLQYRSTTGTSTFNVVQALPNATIQPGSFYLVGASVASATQGSALPTVDAQVTLNLAATAGVVALSTSTVTLANCPLTDPNVVDLVGYGTATTCFEGTAPAGTLSTTTSAARKNVCTDTDNNGSDFAVGASGADIPRNSSSAIVSCGGTAVFTLSGATANPTTVNVGSTTLLTGRITLGPTSSGVTVTADLSALGGSSTQPLYDDATNGDTTKGDNVFNYLATVGSSASAGVKSVKLTATDSQAESSSTTVSITVTATSATTPIHTIQSGAPASAYIGKTVTTSGIVTAIGTGGFYLEARDSAQDSDPSTSEGIFVVTNTSNSAIAVGNELAVTGTVQVTSSSSTTPATEINGTVTMTVVTTGNALPTPITLTAANDSPTGGFTQFLRYQSMRVLIPSFTTTAPTGGTLAETSETVTSDGTFWGVVTGVARPFVEPGISVLETSLPSGTPSTVPRFDGNPELIYVSSTFLGGTALNVTSNQTITNFLGIFDFTTNTAVFAPDKTTPGTLGAPMAIVVAPKPAANEFTIASMNLERFYSDVKPDNGGLTLTTPAYQGRLSKASLLVRNVLGSPDIVGIQEMGQLSTLKDLAAKISTDAVAAGQTDPKYLPFLSEATDTINTAFLVSQNRVTVTDVRQVGLGVMFTNSTGASAVLNDRTPLVLHAIVNIPGYTAYPVTVISNHLKALTGVDDTTSTGATVRLKKEAQAEYLANLVQTYQSNGERVVTLGDLNAFPFNDGYVDVVGVIRGNPVAAGQSVITGAPNLVTPILTDLITTITDPSQQYDYTYIGNAQSLDHILTTSNITGAHLFYVHEDADFPLINYNDPTTPLNTSDHDGGVAYFPLLASGQTSTATLTPTLQDFGSVAQGTASTARPIVFTNTGNTALTMMSIVAAGDFSQTNNCGTSVAVGGSCTINVTFTPTTTGARTGSLTVVSSSITNRTLSTSLTGTGLSASATLALNPSALSFTSLVAGGVSAAQTITVSNSGGVAATLGTIAVTGDFTQTNTCGGSVASLGNCTVSVVFKPSAVGARTGSLSIPVTAPAGAGTLTASLSGTGAAQASLSAATAFPSTFTGKSSAAQAITLTNLSTSAITLSATSISVGTNFTQTNTCGTSLAASATCTISVVFAPTAAGALTGTLTVTPTIGTVSTTVTTALSGTGQITPDFTLTPTSQSGTLTAGTSASTTLTLSSVAGSGYTGTVAISCSGAPAGSTCNLSTKSLTLALNTTTNQIAPLNLNVVISTTKASSAGFAGLPGRSGMILLLVSLGSAGLMLTNRRKLRGAALFLALLTVAMWTTGCGSGNTPSASTPSGSYVYTITATDGTLTHTATYNLTVQ